MFKMELRVSLHLTEARRWGWNDILNAPHWALLLQHIWYAMKDYQLLEDPCKSWARWGWVKDDVSALIPLSFSLSPIDC